MASVGIRLQIFGCSAVLAVSESEYFLDYLLLLERRVVDEDEVGVVERALVDLLGDEELDVVARDLALAGQDAREEDVLQEEEGRLQGLGVQARHLREREDVSGITKKKVY